MITVRIPSARNHPAPYIILCPLANTIMSIIPETSRKLPRRREIADSPADGLLKQMIPAIIRNIPAIIHITFEKVLFIKTNLLY